MLLRLFPLFRVLLCLLPTPVLAAQPSAPEPISAPLRELTWGQLNFLHTTDTHGWLAGHLQEYAMAARAYSMYQFIDADKELRSPDPPMPRIGGTTSRSQRGCARRQSRRDGIYW